MPRNEQLPIPGTEPPKIRAIEAAAVTYTDRREKFQKASESVQEAKTRLIEVMQANATSLPKDADGNAVYKFDDELVILSDKINVKVKPAPKPEDE